MINKLIEKKVNELTKEDIIVLSSGENIKLNNNEVDIIYITIKNNWRVLVYGDPTNIFNNLKNKINKDSYDKLIQIYSFYKNKYKNYL